MITRDQALQFLNENVENKNIIKHMIAAEVMMKAIAAKLKSQNSKVKIDEEINEDEWAMAGLLHDGDYNPGVPVEKQGIKVTEMLREKGYEIPDTVAHAMAAHNWHNTGVEPKSLMDWSLFCGDSLTGLIVAGCLVLPSKKLSDLTVESVLKRYKEPSFAKGTRRGEIAMCEEKLGIPLQEFVERTLKAMQGISNELGL
ncbi:phosphohydrolase [Candidatus Shapirobacteria bacterium CG08_land_8_20_14_0_20_39_18]|uniref:Phosphohydrolase n=1 Tax=Candidatus Shapirobacteria bacterium CG08_land_8_20_14_0_20_39_18 TaxID=1974883 RepID=A0A2M6XDP1_9BACT|nr:MAG: phosphohydrolase [Candidatus Shapirobacteria bacterium CG08_land_8_20_14_0_20_39_18]PIY66240.1 MAG: phosphohydrolase [Candidatus Shapirobacteria bacterium CG_4_10_14_0_8_um_filter_39_15]PJE68547.1 MAG: phosphohydrolase [Candidatus Shapirobacteria bacterium CG10_big_fil_rev_8_21_14_0_10_38_8]